MAEQKSDYDIQTEKINARMSRIKRKIIVMSGKGGVGKTTVTVNLANALRALGATVGVLDVDIHGPNVGKMFGCENGELGSPDGVTLIPVEAENGIKVMSLSFALPDPEDAIIWRGAMKMSAIRQFLGDTEWGDLDYLIIDTPPGTGDEQLTAIQSIPNMTGAIIVTTPQQVAILDSRRSVTFARRCGLPIIGVVENMSGLKCPDCGTEIPVFGIGGGQNMALEMNVPFLGRVPMELDLMNAEDNGQEWVKEPGTHPSAEALRAIADKIQNGDACTTGRSMSFINTSSCSPEACAHCTSNCSSKKA
ncbi:MAG: Mrp/NBP35 family ATP-binding protein [Spirochaetales bacterium]|nr:Mrp/NBP35 family ATP-binding protein [Candidatus Physcosoma equi]